MANNQKYGYDNNRPHRRWPTEYEKWTIKRKLTTGKQGRLFIVHRKDKSDSSDYVLKQAKTPQHIGLIRNEAKALKKLNHDRIITLVDCEIDSDFPYVVTPYHEAQTLEDTDLSEWTNKQKLMLYHRISEAVSRIHSRNIVHRDINTQNILMIKDKPLVLDFSSSRIYDDTLTPNTTTDLCSLGHVFYWIFEQKTFGRGWTALHSC